MTRTSPAASCPSPWQSACRCPHPSAKFLTQVPSPLFRRPTRRDAKGALAPPMLPAGITASARDKFTERRPAPWLVYSILSPQHSVPAPFQSHFLSPAPPPPPLTVHILPFLAFCVSPLAPEAGVARQRCALPSHRLLGNLGRFMPEMPVPPRRSCRVVPPCGGGNDGGALRSVREVGAAPVPVLGPGPVPLPVPSCVRAPANTAAC